MNIRALLCKLGYHDWHPWDLSDTLKREKERLKKYDPASEKYQMEKCPIDALEDAVKEGRPRYCPRCNLWDQGTQPCTWIERGGKKHYRVMTEVKV